MLWGFSEVRPLCNRQSLITVFAAFYTNICQGRNRLTGKSWGPLAISTSDSAMMCSFLGIHAGTCASEGSRRGRLVRRWNTEANVRWLASFLSRKYSKKLGGQVYGIYGKARHSSESPWHQSGSNKLWLLCRNWRRPGSRAVVFGGWRSLRDRC